MGSAPYRILHLIEGLGFGGGAERRLVNDLRLMREERFRHTVVHFSDQNELAPEIEERGIPVLSVRGVFPADAHRVLARLIRLFRQLRPDIVHTQLFWADCLGRLAGAVARVPVLMTTVQSSVYEPGVPFFRAPVRRWLDACTGRLFTHQVVAVSRFVARSVTERLGWPRERVSVLYNALGPEVLAIRPSAVDALERRRALGVEQCSPVLLTVGKLNPPKAVDVLIEAVALARERWPSVACIVVGDGPERQNLETLVARLGLTRHVQFLGVRRDTLELLQAADLFCFPSISEGLPMSLLEAMALGKPVIVSDVGPMPEVVEGGVTGWLVL